MTTLSLDKTLTAVITSIRKYAPDISGRHLDIGSGTGELIRQVQAEFDVHSHACDYTDEFMQIDGQHVDIVDLNTERLPYEDAFFDLITFTEVVEHLEHFRLILREAERVLKPGGLLVVTTPNILNLKSRIRFLFTGFWNLFGPLHVGETAIESAGGHISPMRSWMPGLKISAVIMTNTSAHPFCGLFSCICRSGCSGLTPSISRKRNTVPLTNTTPVSSGRSTASACCLAAHSWFPPASPPHRQAPL